MLGYWIWVVVGALGLTLAWPRLVYAAADVRVPRASARVVVTSLAAAVVAGAATLPWFGRAGGWILAMAAASVAGWYLTVREPLAAAQSALRVRLLGVASDGEELAQLHQVDDPAHTRAAMLDDEVTPHGPQALGGADEQADCA